MDDDRLRSFAERRTWRWRPNPDDRDHYAGVETTDDGFRFFAWSHLDDGLTRDERQSFADFEARGPAWPLPRAIEEEVRAWLAEHRVEHHQS